MHGRISFILVSFSLFCSTAFAATQQELSRAELLKFRPQLGGLSAKQNQIFQEEILSDPERFVKAIKGTQVQVDESAVRQVLAFDATTLGYKNAPVVGFASRAQAGCTACEREANSFQNKLQTRFERRGFQVKKLGAVEITEGSSDPFSQIALQQQLQGILVIDVTQELKDQEQVLTGKMHLRLLKLNSTVHFTSDEDFEMPANDSLALTGEQWLTRSWMKLASTSASSQTNIQANTDRLNIEILGCESLKQFHDLRTKFQTLLTSASALAESSFEPGRIVFWVEGYPASSTLTEVLRMGLQSDPTVLQVVNTNSNTVTLNVKGDES